MPAMTDPRHLLTMLQNAKGAVAEPVVREHVQTMMAHRTNLQQALQRLKDPTMTADARSLAAQHAQGLLGKFSEHRPQLRALAEKLAKMTPMQQHAASDAFKAHTAGSAASAAPRMVRDPHALAARRDMLHDPGSYTPQGQMSSGLETAMTPGRYKKASEIDKLAAMLQKDAAAAAAAKPKPGFMARGFRQLENTSRDPSTLTRGISRAYEQGGGGLGGAYAAAKKYAPGAAMVAAPLAAGAALGGLAMSGGSGGGDDQHRTINIGSLSGSNPSLQKVGFSLTDAGHRLDAVHHNADADSAHARIKGFRDYHRDAPHLSNAASLLDILGLLTLPISPLPVPFNGGKGGGIGALRDMVDMRHSDYAAKKHEKGENAYNPFGGVLTTSRQEAADKANKTAAYGPEVRKLAGMMGTVGRGMGMAGKALGVLPTGVGNAAGAVLGAAGGAMAAPPGKRMMGAAAGSLSGLPGGAGFVAPAVASHLAGV